MFVKRLLCFAVLLFGIETVALTMPLFLRAHNRTDDLAPVDAHFDPCKNFYGYSCTPWMAQVKKPPFEPVWNPWIAVNHKIKSRLSKILTRRDPNLVKPQIFYKSCLNIIERENTYLKELTSLVDTLGGWPLIDNKWEGAHYDWLTHLSKITRLTGIHPILKIHADLDYKDPERFIIYVEPGNLILPQHVLTGSGITAELEAYEKWILDTAFHMYGNTSDGTAVKELIKFEMRLAKMMGTKSRSLRSTIKKLGKKFSADWLAAFNHTFGGFTQIKPNTTIAIKNYAYLKNVFLLIDKVGYKSVANYLIWSVIRDLSRETTNHMRDLNFLIDHAILGVKDDLSREYECLDKIILYFSPLLIPPYLKRYVNPRIFPTVRSMVDSIKTEFINILTKSEWLSKEGKLLSAEKVKSIRPHLGYPSEIFNLQSHYRKLQMTNDHFLNIMKLKKFKMVQLLSQFSEKPATMWPSTPFDVNAYYSILQNSIFIPLGLLEPPFFLLNREEILNFGALGSLIGHEISHSLDPAGILADSSGKIHEWFPIKDLALYKKRIQCLGDENTIGENMADSNGLKISLGAVRNHSQSFKKFFIGFAQMWCEASDMDFFVEEHAANSDRVLGLSNNQDFRETFECGFGNLCEMW